MKDHIQINSIEELTEEYIVFTTEEESYSIRGGYFVHFEKDFENHLVECCDGCVKTKDYILNLGLKEFHKIQNVVDNLNQFIVDNPNFIKEYGVTKLD